MSTSNHRKRFWMWVGVALLIELAAFTLWKRWYWFFPTHAVSEVYSRYAGTDGLNVVFLKDFKVNDTLLLDVTLLEAKDSAGWERLLNDFHLENVIDTSAYRQPHSFSISMVSPKDPTKRISSPDEPFCSRVTFPYEREIHIYSTENDDHCMALHMHLMLNLSKQQTIKRK